jgi:hypothetical protein
MIDSHEISCVVQTNSVISFLLSLAQTIQPNLQKLKLPNRQLHP